jgi:hypothetical protein
MPDVKISALPASTTPLAGTEVLPIVQSATTRQVSVANLTAGRSVEGTNFIPSGSSVPTNGLYLPAANTIGVATNSTNVATFNSVGILGIGVTPSNWGSGFKALEVGYVGSGINATAFAQTNVVGNAYGNSGWKYAGTGVASLYQQNGSGAHAWSYAVSGTIGNAISWIEAMGINSNGGIKVLNTIGVGATTPSTSGAGITFPATQSASSDANTLDDYEEGVWTPIVEGSTTAGTATYGVQMGRYTKIGNTVRVYFAVNYTGHTGTGTTVVGGFPFTSNGGNQTPFSVFTYGETFTANNVANGGIMSNGSTVWLHWQVPVGGGISSGIPINASAEIQVSGVYQTA